MGFLNIHPENVKMGFLGKDFRCVFPDKCSNHDCIIYPIQYIQSTTETITMSQWAPLHLPGKLTLHNNSQYSIIITSKILIPRTIFSLPPGCIKAREEVDQFSLFPRNWKYLLSSSRSHCTLGPTQGQVKVKVKVKVRKWSGHGQVRSNSNSNSNSKVGPELYTKIGFHHHPPPHHL